MRSLRDPRSPAISRWRTQASRLTKAALIPMAATALLRESIRIRFHWSNRMQLFYGQNIHGGANTVTAQFSSTNNHPWLAIYEYQGVDTANALDRTAHAQGSDASPSTDSVVITGSPELAFIAAGLPATAFG